jgi:hypothetical protein
MYLKMPRKQEKKDEEEDTLHIPTHRNKVLRPMSSCECKNAALCSIPSHHPEWCSYHEWKGNNRQKGRIARMKKVNFRL